MGYRIKLGLKCLIKLVNFILFENFNVIYIALYPEMVQILLETVYILLSSKFVKRNLLWIKWAKVMAYIK